MIEHFNAFIQTASEYVVVASFVISIASGLSALTPTPKDDGIVMILKKILAIFSLNIGNAKSLSDIQPR